MIEVTAVLAGTALAVIGGLHVLWAATPWPLPSRADLARDVVGRRSEDLPPIFAPLSVLVGVLLVAAAYLVVAEAAVLPAVPSSGLVTAGTWAVAAVLALRGVAGFVDSGLGVSQAPPTYRRLDVRVYSPLCLVLALLIAVVALG